MRYIKDIENKIDDIKNFNNKYIHNNFNTIYSTIEYEPEKKLKNLQSDIYHFFDSLNKTINKKDEEILTLKNENESLKEQIKNLNFHLNKQNNVINVEL